MVDLSKFLDATICVGNTKDPQQALIVLHGRGATAESLLPLVARLALPGDVLVVLPQAKNDCWYPGRFTDPMVINQPALEVSLGSVAKIITVAFDLFGIEASQVSLAGFSQGACLAAEFLKRNPRQYKAVAIWSGGLIGEEQDIKIEFPGSFAGTPVYLGCDEDDPHIPAQRVQESANYFRRHDAQVSAVLYQNLGHTVHEAGIAFLREHVNQR